MVAIKTHGIIENCNAKILSDFMNPSVIYIENTKIDIYLILNKRKVFWIVHIAWITNDNGCYKGQRKFERHGKLISGD